MEKQKEYANEYQAIDLIDKEFNLDHYNNEQAQNDVGDQSIRNLIDALPSNAKGEDVKNEDSFQVGES